MDGMCCCSVDVVVNNELLVMLRFFGCSVYSNNIVVTCTNRTMYCSIITYFIEQVYATRGWPIGYS